MINNRPHRKLKIE